MASPAPSEAGPGSAAEPGGEKVNDALHAPGVARADGRNLRDLPFDKSDGVVLPQDARLPHPVVLVDRELMANDLDSHAGTRLPEPWRFNTTAAARARARPRRRGPGSG